MAKKKTQEVVEEPQVQETVVVEVPNPKPTPVVQKPKKKGWEYKDRIYYLKGNKKPLSRRKYNMGHYYIPDCPKGKIIKYEILPVKVKKYNLMILRDFLS